MHRHARTARRPDDLEACQTIVRGLPDFFTDDVPDKIANDLDAHHGWVITSSGSGTRSVGCVSVMAAASRRLQAATIGQTGITRCGWPHIAARRPHSSPLV